VLRELTAPLGLSQAEVARRCGRGETLASTIERQAEDDPDGALHHDAHRRSLGGIRRMLGLSRKNCTAYPA
jgi:hypothetical protein